MEKINKINIAEQMRNSYLDYAMSVIISRALPDARDGLKPVHRRILYAMHEMGLTSDKAHKKSARVVGDVIGKYHPHGDSAIYGALVRLAQNFSLREILIEGQGNFGSIDGDSAAQMRYTEVRLSKLSNNVLTDINLGTVDFQDNYDGTETEPKVLPARFPNLLVNGANGIAVGMATNIPTHNLGEVIDACCAYIDDNNIEPFELTQFILGPDFPTGAIIKNGEQARHAMCKGRGSFIVRATTSVEEIGGKNAIIIHDVPYQVNKSELVSKIAYLTKDKIIEGITEIRDESNKLGVRVVIEMRKDIVPEILLNQLFKLTELQTSFSYNMLAIDHGRPKVMGLKDVIVSFIEFRKEVIERRTTYLLNRARERCHLLIGLSLAVSNIDEIIAVIRSSPDAQAAKEELLGRSWDALTLKPLLLLVDDARNTLTDDSKCRFTEEQVKAILEMRLQRLTALEKNKIEDELKNAAEEMKKYLHILGNQEELIYILKAELIEVKKAHATPRLTQIQNDDTEMDIEDFIKKEDVIVTYTFEGYIKHVPLSTYKAQKRGGRGKSATQINEDDILRDVIVTNTHATLLFFTSSGQVYRTKVYKLPAVSRQAKGRPIINILPIAQNDKISAIMQVPSDIEEYKNSNVVFITAQGQIRRNELNRFSNINANGKIAIRLESDDSLINVAMCHNDEHILIATRLGKAIRFSVSSLRVFASTTSDGVRGIKLVGDDRVISMAILKASDFSTEDRLAFFKINNELIKKIIDTESHEEKLAIAAEAGSDLLSAPKIVQFIETEQYILTVNSLGFGKRTSSHEYRVSSDRGGMGVVNMDIREGEVIASMPVHNNDEILVMTNLGTLIRTSVSDIRITSRDAKGVKIIDLNSDEKVISVTVIAGSNDEEIKEAEDINNQS